MRRIGGDPWTFRTSTDPNIDFCVWVLLEDGLRVPPFDRHADGSGFLRAAGLDRDSWTGWFIAEVQTANARQDAPLTHSTHERSRAQATVDAWQLVYRDEPPSRAEFERVRRAVMETA